MHIAYIHERRYSFHYTLIFLFLDIIILNILEDCGILRFVSTFRIYWYILYLVVLYHTNTLLRLYVLWFLDVLRFANWIYSILLISTTDYLCQMKTYLLVIVILHGVIYTTIIDVRKVDPSFQSEISHIQIDRNHTINLYTFCCMPSQARVSQIETNCSICLETVPTGTVVPDLLCGHTFHQQCLELWIEYNPICPMCRMPIINS